MKCLFVIDVQNGFVSKRTEYVVPRIEKLMTDFNWDLILATKFFNLPDSGFTDIMHWSRLKTSPETDLLANIEEYADRVIEKTIYSACTKETLELLEKNKIKEVFISGIDTDCCVLKTAIDLFERNIRPIVLSEYCASNGGQESHNAAIRVLQRTIGYDQINYDIDPFADK